MKSLVLVLVLLFLTAGGNWVAGQSAVSTSASDYSRDGINFLREKRYADALEAFQNSARLDPRSARTFGNIGSTSMLLKKPAEAVLAYQKAIDLEPTNPSFRSAMCNGLVVTHDYTKAVTACREAARLDIDSPDAQSALIHVMRLAHGATGEIEQLVGLALRRFPESISVLGEAAEFNLTMGNAERAAELFQRLADVKPDDAYYYARIAEIYLRLGRDDEAIASARKALAIEPLNPFANFFMGKLFLELGLHEEASVSLKKVLDRDPDFPEARFYFGISEKRRNRLDSALLAFSYIATSDPGVFQYQLELGSILSTLACYEDAIQPYRNAVKLKPTDLEALAGLGLVLFESGRFPEAIDVLQEADRLYPGNEVITMFLRVSRARQRSIPTIDSLIATAKENPADWETRVELIQLLAYARRIEEAEPYVQEVWKLAPKEVGAYVTIAVGYSTAGKTDKALDAYQRGLAIKADVAVYAGFASIYAKQGEVEKASAAYAKVFELQPNTPGIMKLFADQLQDWGKRREALEMYKRSLALKPLFPPALSNAAILSAKLSDMAGAQQYLTVLRSVDPALARKIEFCLRFRLWN